MNLLIKINGNEKGSLTVFSIRDNIFASEVLLLFRNFLCLNGESILKTLKIIFTDFEDEIPLNLFNDDLSINVNSKSSSFSQCNDYFKSDSKILIFKEDSECDEKLKFLQKIQVFKEIYGMKKKKKKVLKTPKQSSKSFSRHIMPQSLSSEEFVYFNKEEYSKIEDKLKLLINISKKEEKDPQTIIPCFWENFISNIMVLKTLKNKLEDALKTKEALVIIHFFKFSV